MRINAGSKNWRIASFTILLAMLFAVSQAPALATGGGDGCAPGRSSDYLTDYFAGSDANEAGSSFGGIYGTIREYSPYVADSSSENKSSQWVMLDATGDQWAQIGWIEFPGGKRNVFVEFHDPGAAEWDDYFPSYAINSSVEFQVLYTPTCPESTCFSFFENGSSTQLTGTKYNFTPNDAQSFAEIHDRASQIPGGYNNKSSVTNLHVYYNAGTSGAWHIMDGYDYTEEITTGGEGNAPSWANVSNNGLYGNSSYQTWDSACSS